MLHSIITITCEKTFAENPFTFLTFRATVEGEGALVRVRAQNLIESPARPTQILRLVGSLRFGCSGAAPAAQPGQAAAEARPGPGSESLSQESAEHSVTGTPGPGESESGWHDPAGGPSHFDPSTCSETRGISP